MGLNLGELRYKIQVLSSSGTTDSYGSTNEVWVNSGYLRAGKKEISGTKTIDGNEIFNSNRIDWYIHYRKEINATMRIKFNNLFYRILFVKEIGYREGLIIETELINL